jgi:hypothetical protein
MIKVTLYRFIFLLAIMSLGCSCGPKQPKSFYNTIASWDISYIPIIKPYRAVSVDRGSSWSIEIPETSDNIDVLRFGVSGNFIYGKEEPSFDMLMNSGNENAKRNWFLFDTKAKLHTRYKTEEELIRNLDSLSIPVNAIVKCKTYFDSLCDDHKLYWYPKD